jgi:hypothetical protein
MRFRVDWLNRQIQRERLPQEIIYWCKIFVEYIPVVRSRCVFSNLVFFLALDGLTTNRSNGYTNGYLFPSRFGGSLCIEPTDLRRAQQP